MEGAALLDLVCGPASPLADTHQRYRLVSHLGSGGQAEVYRAVRVCNGISSAPVTVKVFRMAGDRPPTDQLRSWDKGDAVLMDLNSRGVPGICRRSDGFYGPLPAPPGQRAPGDPVPYQVLDYLHGVTLREYVAQRYGLGGAGPRLDAVAALTTLAGVLQALHQPGDPRACPVLHMDVKPSNVIVLTGGEVRLIDFTGARYYWRDHITSVAYTLEAGGPEAFSGNVGPAYDVHGFGAVAYYLVTGAFPRTEASPPDGVTAPPWAVLRRHPLLDANPGLREHLLAPVADRPEDRPHTKELSGWVRRLAELVSATPRPDVGLDWSGSARIPVASGLAAAPLTGTETGAFQRIEKLERELVELRTALGGGVARPSASSAAPTRVAGAATGGSVPG
ncbi:MAG: protein kinase domain-containing protein, partial [Micromonosporaceae bacterium]